MEGRNEEENRDRGEISMQLDDSVVIVSEQWGNLQRRSATTFTSRNVSRFWGLIIGGGTRRLKDAPGDQAEATGNCYAAGGFRVIGSGR